MNFLSLRHAFAATFLTLCAVGTLFFITRPEWFAKALQPSNFSEKEINILANESYRTHTVQNFSSYLQWYYQTYRSYPSQLKDLIVEDTSRSIDDPIVYSYEGETIHIDRKEFQNEISFLQYRRSTDGQHFVISTTLPNSKKEARSARPNVTPEFLIEDSYLGVDCSDSYIFCRTDKYICPTLQDCRPFNVQETR